MKTEEIQKFETLFSSGTNQIQLHMQIEVTELQNREITKDGFNKENKCTAVLWKTNIEAFQCCAKKIPTA